MLSRFRNQPLALSFDIHTKEKQKVDLKKMARVSSTSVTVGTVINTLILVRPLSAQLLYDFCELNFFFPTLCTFSFQIQCFGIYLVVCVARLAEHENAKYVLPKLGDLYADQTLALFGVLCLGVAILGYVVIFCFGDCCFNIVSRWILPTPCN